MGSRRNRRGSDMPVNSESIDFQQVDSNNFAQDARVRFNFTDVEDLIRKFSGDETMNVRKWFVEFEQYATTLRLNELQRFILCKRSLEGAAKLYIECEAKPLTYSALKESLYREFLPKISCAEVHKKLQTRKKKRDESFREYLYKLIDIASQVEMDELSIIGYFINGIDDTSHNKSILYSAKTISELKEKLIVYEKIKSDARRSTVFEPDLSKAVPTRKRNDNQARATRYCYNCGSSSHERHACPEKEKGPKCFECNRFGHKKPDCPNKRLPTTSTHIAVVNNATIVAKVNGVSLNCLVDTGSDISLIKDSCLNLLNPNFIFRNASLSISGLGSTVVTKGHCTFDIEINSDTYPNIDVHIVENSCMKVPMILGMDILRQAIIKIDGGSIFITKKEVKADEPKNEQKSECILAEIKVDLEPTYLDMLNLNHLNKDRA